MPKIISFSDHSYPYDRIHSDHYYCKTEDVSRESIYLDCGYIYISYLVPHSFADVVKSITRKTANKNEIITVSNLTPTPTHTSRSLQKSEQT